MYDKNLRDRMATMQPRELQQFAMLHKNDPFIVSMALDIDNTRKAAQRQQAMQAVGQPQPTVVDQDLAAISQPAVPPQAMQAAPQAQAGLPQLPAQNIASMADGGIAGYAEGDEVKGGREDYRAYAMRRAREMGLDPKFVDGIFGIESGYDPKAKSKTGPQGIGQLTSYIAKTFGLSPKERLDPYKNMDASLGFMDYLNKKYKGDKAKMAVAYNQGEPVLDAHLKRNKGQLVPETLHEDVKTANKKEPANYLKRMTEAGALAPTQTAEAGTREAPRTPEMLERQKRAISNRELLASLPLSEARAGDERPAAKKGEFFPSNMLNPDIGRPRPALSAPATTPAAVSGGRFSAASVPGTPEAAAYDEQVRNARAKKEAERSLFDKLYGAAEAAHATVLGAPLTAMGLTAFDPVARFLEPKTEVGKEYAQNVQQALVEKGKLPPYIPGIGMPRAPKRAPAALETANLAEATAKAARERAETAKAPRLPAPEVTKPATPLMEEIQAARAADAARQEFSVAPETAEVGLEALNRRKLAEQAADVAKAENVARAEESKAAVAGDEASAAELADRLVGERQGRNATGETFLSVPGLAGQAAADKEIPPATTPYTAYSEEPGYDFTKPAAAEKAGEVPIEERSTMAEPEKKTGMAGLSDEDWMMMGLNMLQAPAGQSGSALSQLAQNIGRSGLATLGAKKEREQREFDKLQKQALTDYYKGMTQHLGQEPGDIRSLQALMANPKLRETAIEMERAKDITRTNAALVGEFYKAAAMNPNLSWNDFVQKYQALGGMGGTGGFKVLGSRPQ